jgi:hypothetical protein
VNADRPAPRVAVMQPYLFSYIGYFQLISACDVFVYYDDVTFIKGGWINRNRILLNGEPHRFSVPLSGASSNALIKDVRLAPGGRWTQDFSATLRQAYRRAPHFDRIQQLVESVLNAGHTHIADLAIASIQAVCDYLDLPVLAHRSSSFAPDTRALDRSDRLIAMTRRAGGQTYINPAGGSALYRSSHFADNGVRLQFLEPVSAPYPQFGVAAFVPGLSIIDVLMFNDVEQIRQMLTQYSIA